MNWFENVDISGLIAIILFYVVIFAVGIWAAWTRRSKSSDVDELILASRDIGPFVGLLTLTATWVGGGYINGSAEAIYDDGLALCQAPFGYAISLGLGGYFFAKRMRDAGYVTMLDPLQDLFGQRWGSFLYFPALAGEMLWSASILAALGSTLQVMVGLEEKFSVLVSAGIAVSYTLFGGLASVAYTDVVQLFCIFIGLWLTIPFAINDKAVGSLKEIDWVGSINDTRSWSKWIDYYMLLIFGGIPWQVYFQRVLSARTSKQAEYLSYAASVGCIIMVIPACFIGVIAKATDWEETALNSTTIQSKNVLPLVMKYLTPKWVSFLGLGAVSAAVMSSADSSVLSASTMFSRNLYKNVFRQKAGTKEQVIVMKISVIAIAGLSCYIALQVTSVYKLFSLCGDLVYVMLFPQLTMAVHFPTSVNIYGSIAGYSVGFLIRILGGEPVLGIPTVIQFPWYDHQKEVQYFPFRTLSMVITFVTMIAVSAATKHLFMSRKLSKKYDFLNAYKKSFSITSVGIDNPSADVSDDRAIKMTNKKA